MVDGKIERPAPPLTAFAYGLLEAGAIDFLLPSVLVEGPSGPYFLYDSRSFRPLLSCLDDLREDLFLHCMRQIIRAFYDLEEEYLLPSSFLSLDKDDLWVDRDNRVYLMISAGGHRSLFSLMADLLGARWQEDMPLPSSRTDWYDFLDGLEDFWERKTIFVHAPEEVDSPPKEKEEGPGGAAFLASVRPVYLIVAFWTVCLLLGLFLGRLLEG